MAKKKVTIGKGMSMSKKELAKTRKEPGKSNAGKYKNVAKSDFAGADGTYPIDTKKRAKSALKLAHNSPNAGKIKAKVYSKYPGLKKKKG